MATGKPLVSVVVPVYRVEEYLGTCVESLISQSYDNLEIILVDDGSPDSCGRICDNYTEKDIRVRVLHQANGGVSAARNAGVRVACGDYIAFVDADDWAEPDYIEHLLDLIFDNSADISVCRSDADKDEKISKVKLFSGDESLRVLLYQKLFDTGPWAKLMRSEIAKANPFPEGMFFEDLAVVCRMFGMAGRVAYSNERKYHYRKTPSGTMNGKDISRLLDEITAADMMCGYVKEKFPSLEQACECRRFSAYCQVLMKLPKDEYAEERALLWRQIRNCRSNVMRDSCARAKNRIAAILSFFGEDIMRVLWNVKT